MPRLSGIPALRDLEDDLIPYFGYSGLRCCVFQPAPPQDFGGDIDADVHFLVNPEPVAQLFRHGFQHPIGEHSRQVGSFDEGNELVGLDHSG